MAQTIIRGAETTDLVPASRRVRDVSDRIMYLDPDSAPFTVILMKASSRPAVNSKFEWMEKGLPARFDAINNGGGYASGATALVVDNAAYFSDFDIINVLRTGEKMRVASGGVNTGTNTLTVVRGVGSTAAAALLDNDDLQIIGNAYPEAGTSGPAKSVAETYPFNYTQIIKTPLQASRSEQNSENYGGPDRVRLRLEKGVEHKIDIERTALFGERNIDTGTAGLPVRYTGGVIYFVTSYIKDFGGIVTEPEIEDFMQNVFQKTGAGDSRVFLCSPLWVSILDQIAQARLVVMDRAETFGVTVRQLITSHGTLLIVKDRLLENSPTPAGVVGGPFGYAGYACALDMTRFAFRFLQNSNTMLESDIQAPDYDGWKDQYLTEAGWQIANPEVHGVAKGATG